MSESVFASRYFDFFAPYGVFPLPDSYADSYSDNMQKGYTGTDSDGLLQCKVTMKMA